MRDATTRESLQWLESHLVRARRARVPKTDRVYIRCELLADLLRGGMLTTSSLGGSSVLHDEVQALDDLSHMREPASLRALVEQSVEEYVREVPLLTRDQSNADPCDDATSYPYEVDPGPCVPG